MFEVPGPDQGFGREQIPNRVEGDGGSDGIGDGENTTGPKHELTSNKTMNQDTKLNTTDSEKELCKRLNMAVRREN